MPSSALRRLVLPLFAAITLAAPRPVSGAVYRTLLNAFEFRNLDPFRTSAWVTDFAVLEQPPRDDLRTFYVLPERRCWKTTNSGTTFEPVFDNVCPLAIGAVAVAPDNADLVWVGTGDPDLARYAYAGDGVTNPPTGEIPGAHGPGGDPPRPEDHRAPGCPNTVYVAAMGHLYGPNSERGVFRTLDGGSTWKRSSSSTTTWEPSTWSWCRASPR